MGVRCGKLEAMPLFVSFSFIIVAMCQFNVCQVTYKDWNMTMPVDTYAYSCSGSRVNHIL